MTLDTLGIELENRGGPRRAVPLAVAFEFRRVVLYVHPGRQEMLVHEPHHAFVRPHLGIQPSTAASHWGGAEVEEDRLSLGLRVLQDLIDVMAKLDWHGMLAAGNLLNIAGPSTRTGHEPHPGFFIHATAAAGGALGADPDPALWLVTVPPRISRTRVQPAGTEKREMSTLTATASLSEQEARGIVDAIPQTIVVLSPDGAALYGNRSMLAYTGLTIDEVMAADFRARVFHPEDVARLLDQRRHGLARGVPFELEQRARRQDGQYRWFLVQYNPVRDEHGRTLRWYATGTDIDDRKRVEERTRNENLALREDIDRTSMFEEIIGSSPALQRVLAQVAKVATTDSTVLILGETGTGKELVARAIHKRSRRSSRAFIRVNCPAIPASLIASELFGHEKGAFTGALQRRLGRFEAADGGTIFLDEIGDLPPETQIALLRVLQEREIERLGSSHPITVDVRVLAATNSDLERAVERGAFRSDLFYRLNVFPIRIPPLRERVVDIPVLAEYLIERYAKQAGKRIRTIRKQTLQLLQAYDWPGNVRELQNVIERAVILCEGETFAIDESWLKGKPSHAPIGTRRRITTLAEGERALIIAALAESRGRISGPSGAAAKLGIPRQTLESKIKALHLDTLAFRASQPFGDFKVVSE